MAKMNAAASEDVAALDSVRIGCVTTRYGPPAHQCLADAVAEAQRDDSLTPVTVVVPSHYVGLAARRTLASHAGGIAAVSFVTPYNLAEQLGGRQMAKTGRRPVSTPVIAGAVRTVLRNDPGHFSGVATHPATERSLVEAHRALSEVSEAGLDDLSKQSTRAADVVRIHRAVATSLSSGFSNEQQLVDTAVAAVQSNHRAVASLGKVFVFLPQRLATSQTRLLKAIASVTETTVIAGITGADDADAAIRASLNQLGVKLTEPTARPSWGRIAFAAKKVPGTATADASGAISETSESAEISRLRELLQGRDVRALSLSDADDEVRHAVREVVAAARSGTSLSRCAIVYGAREPYTRLLGDTLTAAGIKYCGASIHTAATSWLGRSLLELLTLTAEGFTRRQVMAWLDTAQVWITQPKRQTTQNSPQTTRRATQDDTHSVTHLKRQTAQHTRQTTQDDTHSVTHPKRQTAQHTRQTTQDSPQTTSSSWYQSSRQRAPVAAWERVARAARVEGGIKDWNDRLTVYRDHNIEQAARYKGNEEGQWLTRRYAQNADHAEALLAFVRELHDHLNPKPAPDTWIAMAKWCRHLIVKYLGGHHRARWPRRERRLAIKVDAVIERLGDLDSVDVAPSPTRFRQALELELAGSTQSHGRFGSGVLAGPVELALGMELDLVVVCGLAEGTFPARGREDALLPDRERRVAGHDLPLRGDRSGDDHRALLAVLAAADRALLLYPRGDLRRSTERSPSRWFLDVAEARAPDGVRPKGDNLARSLGSWFTEVPSLVAGLRQTEFPVSEQEYDAKTLLDWHESDSGSRTSPDSRTSPGSLDTVQRRPELQRSIQMQLARRSKSLTRFDGNLSTDGDLRGVTLPAPTQQTTITSASRLEGWVKCPYAYFVRYLLGVDAVEDDRDNYRISPLDLGSLVHRILEYWIEEAIKANDVPPPGMVWSDKSCQRLRDIGTEECDRLAERGLVGRRVYWHSIRRRLMDDLNRFVSFDNQMRQQHHSTPQHTELGFGLPDSPFDAVEIPLNPSHTRAPRRRLASDTTEASGTAENVRIRGSIDRVDVTADGGLMVIDYKTGSIHSYKDLSADNPTPDGGHLQLVLYAIAARALRTSHSASRAKGGSSSRATSRSIGRASSTADRSTSRASSTADRSTSRASSATDRSTSRASGGSSKASISGAAVIPSSDSDYGAYWFVSSKGGFEPKGYPVNQVRDQVLDTVRSISHGIASGLFPMRPEPRNMFQRWVPCAFCDPDGLGTRAALRDWQRKRNDPVLIDYVNLITTAE